MSQFSGHLGSRNFMNSTTGEGMTLRRAALIAGFVYLLSPVTIAEFSIMPKLVVPGNIGGTVQNLTAHHRLFAIAILCYLITFIQDVVIAWALYILLAPVNRPMSMLSAWFRIVYAIVALCAVLQLVNAYGLLNTPDYLALFGRGPMQAQVKLLLDSFRSDWSISLVIFGIHLVLLGYLVYRSGYISKVLGILLLVDGVGWEIDSLRPYLYPDAHLRWLFITFLGEIFFVLWLLIRGWKIQEP